MCLAGMGGVTGQGVGSVLDIRSCREVVEQVIGEAREAVDALGKLS